MLLRQVLRFLPSAAVAPAAAVVGIWAFSRFLDPTEYGLYSLAWTIVLLVTTVVFQPINISMTRFWADAETDGGIPGLVGAGAVLLLSAGASVTGLAVLLFGLYGLEAIGDSSWWPLILLLWVGLPGVALRAAGDWIANARKAAGHAVAYTASETGFALLSIGSGIVLVAFAGLGPSGILIGYGLAGLFVLAANLPWIVPRAGQPDPGRGATLVRLAVPVAVGNVLVAVIAYASRFVVAYELGVAEVAALTIAQALADRAIAMVLNGVTLGSFPAIVRLEAEQGRMAASRALSQSGGLILAAGIPAAIGLALIAQPLSQILIGPDFRDPVAHLLPLLAVATLIGGIGRFYFDQAFLLAGRSDCVVWCLLPAGVVTIVANFVLVPVWGGLGAVYASLLAHLSYLAAAAFLTRRVYPFAFPWLDAAKVAGASVPMAGFILVMSGPWGGSWGDAGLPGLAGLMAGAVVTYAVAAVLANVAGIRNGLRLVPNPGRFRTTIVGARD